MKSLLIASLIVMVLVALAYKMLLGTSGPNSAKPTSTAAATAERPEDARFLRRCAETQADQKNSTAYCRCLLRAGVRQPEALIASARGQQIARDCAAQNSKAP